MSLGKYAAQMIALLSAFALCWTLAEFGIYYHMELGAVPESTRLVVYIVLAASYFWTSQVCRNVVVVTTSGTGAEWWFGQGLRGPTLTAFLRAITYDLAPIAFGSLFVVVVQSVHTALVFLADQCRTAGRLFDCCGRCFACLVACMGQFAEFMHRHAFVYVGIFGYGFMPAGRKVMGLFVNEGLTMVKNDTVVQFVLFFADVVIALCSCALAIMIAENGSDAMTIGLHPFAHLLVGTIGFVIGLTIASTMTSVIDAANKTGASRVTSWPILEVPEGVMSRRFAPRSLRAVHREPARAGGASVRWSDRCVLGRWSHYMLAVHDRSRIRRSTIN